MRNQFMEQHCYLWATWRVMVLTDTIINFYRTDAELEELILFLVMVAGKTANTTALKLESFLEGHNHCPFVYILKLSDEWKLLTKLREYRTGQYKRTTRAFEYLSSKYTGKDLRTITVEELETVPGIGPKSARCFVSWTQPNVKYAMLDTHILKYLRDVLNIPNVPKSTPTGKRYFELEKVFLDHAAKLGRNPAELDLEIWVSYRV